MKARLSSSLTSVVLVAFVIQGFIYWRGSEAAPVFEPVVSVDLDGQEVLEGCRRTLESSPGFVVDLTQEVELFGQHVLGEGTYLQRGVFGQQTRIDMVYSANGKKVADLQQIDNGRFILTRYQTPASAPQLRRVDLERVRATIDFSQTAVGTPTVSPASGILALVRSFERDFEFSNPQIEVWDGQEVCVITGRWKESELKRRFGIDPSNGDMERQLSRIPEPFPTHVELVVGTDPQLPYFPYRIDFLRRIGSENAGISERIGRIDMQRIDFHAVPEEVEFQLVPSNDVVSDETSEFIATQREHGAALR